MHRTAAATLVAYSASQSSGAASSQPRLANAPALLTRMSHVSASQRAGDGPGAVAGIGQVSRQALGLAAVSADCLCHRVDRMGPAAVHDHRRTLGCELPGDGLADAAAGTSHDGPVAFELQVHRQLPLAAVRTAASSAATASAPSPIIQVSGASGRNACKAVLSSDFAASDSCGSPPDSRRMSSR